MDVIVGGHYSADQSAALSRTCCLEHNTSAFLSRGSPVASIFYILKSYAMHMQMCS